MVRAVHFGTAAQMNRNSAEEIQRWVRKPAFAADRRHLGPVCAHIVLVPRQLYVVLLVALAVIGPCLEPGMVGFERAESRQKVQPFLLQIVGHDALWRIRRKARPLLIRNCQG